ncbi:MAG TPA: LysR family transcriptional regulator [Steroidobacteraceae bacterium]|nr:LysR family transcriptional regulator [Steroidobacteraceae bacterium]
MADRLTSMQVFVSVAETGSFTAAAAAMGISATMVGKHIRMLEKRLGGPLIERTTRRQALTQTGKLYLERARQALAAVAAAESAAEEMASEPRGLLRVHATVSLGAHVIAPLVARYLKLYPQVSIDLMLADRDVRLVEEGFDLTVSVAKRNDPALIGRELGRYQMWLCASPAYLERRGTPRKPRDLEAHDCLSFAYWRRKDAWRLTRGKRTETVKVQGRLTINSGQALKNAAVQGAGIIMQPALLLADEVSAGRLVRVLPAYTPPARPISLLYSPAGKRTLKVRTFVDFMVEALRTEAGPSQN